MAKRIKKNKDQRVWAIKQVIESNRQADKLVRVKKVNEIFRNERSCKDNPLLRLWKVKGAEGTSSNDSSWQDTVI
jgi:hypothetical protein